MSPPVQIARWAHMHCQRQVAFFIPIHPHLDEWVKLNPDSSPFPIHPTCPVIYFDGSFLGQPCAVVDLLLIAALPEKQTVLEIVRNDLCSYSGSDIPRVSYFI